MKLATREVGSATIIDFEGRLDTRTVDEAEQELMGQLQGSPDQFLINLSQLEFVSSAGLRTILRAAKLVRGKGGVLKVSSARGVVKEVLEISGLDSLLQLYEDEEQALAAF